MPLDLSKYTTEQLYSMLATGFISEEEVIAYFGTDTWYSRIRCADCNG